VSLDSLREAKEQVRQAVDIVDLVGSYVQLRREGRGYKAICPWHDDRRPSLQVNPQRQSFKCWVCDIGGDVFSFVMKMENVGFPEALQMLADRAGVQLRKLPPGATAAAADEKRQLFQALSWAEQHFHDCLLSDPAAEEARNYLAERGLSPETIRRFRLGYSPDEWDWLIKRSHGTPHTIGTLEKVGLVSRRQKGPGYYDRFRGRLLFSIRDVQGRPVAFGGRVLPGAPADAPKYVNSPETRLFSKSDTLYGLDSARDAVAKAKDVVVMEGYTDCLMARQCGVEHTVAVLGTALNERHIKLLRRFTERVTLVLDGDEAGQRRTNEILELFVAQQFDLRILTLPDGLDPCDFMRRHGSEPFRALLEGAVDALEHKLRSVRQAWTPHAGMHQVSRAVEDILSTLAKAPRLAAQTDSAARLREQQILARLAREARVPEESLRARLGDLRRSAKVAARGEAPPEPASESEHWERELIELLLRWPEHVPAVAERVPPEWLRPGRCREIYVRCCALGPSPELFEQLLLELDEPEMKNLLVELDEQSQAKSALESEGRMEELIASFRRRSAEPKRRAQAAVLHDERLEEPEQLAVLQQLIEQERARQGISMPTDG
jgi:DNA primase